MARPVRTSLASDEYLILVGQFAYMAASVEGLLMFDLNGLKQYLPEQLRSSNLAGKSTTGIGQEFLKYSVEVADPDVRVYIETGGRHLCEIARIRNHVLHARPVTWAGVEQILYRWRPDAGDYFPITKDWLSDQIDTADMLSAELNRLRPLHKHTAFREGSVDTQKE